MKTLFFCTLSLYNFGWILSFFFFKGFSSVSFLCFLNESCVPLLVPFLFVCSIIIYVKFIFFACLCFVGRMRRLFVHCFSFFLFFYFFCNMKIAMANQQHLSVDDQLFTVFESLKMTNQIIAIYHYRLFVFFCSF